MTEQKTGSHKRNDKINSVNPWKITAIVFICVFVLILMLGIIRLFHYRTQVDKLTQDDILSAKTLVQGDLSKRGLIFNESDILLSESIRRDPRFPLKIVEAHIKRNNVSYNYVIDLTNSKIVVYTQTEFYGDMRPFGFPITRERKPFR